jgi:hypothetical protein
MQALDVEYDLSFFDTDPFEPVPGGTMSLWPFALGRFIELPYTLAQDFTLTDVVGERTPRLWLEKIDFLARYFGMALVNSHPDYLRDPARTKLYRDFLEAVRRRTDCWHALPRDVARWWRARAMSDRMASLPGAVDGIVHREEGGRVTISPASPAPGGLQHATAAPADTGVSRT